MSEFDPLVVAHFVLRRWPRFLTKSSLFDTPLQGPFLGELRQIPVYRGTAAAAAALQAAAEAVRAGHGVIAYPEATTPKEGDFRTRTGKTGVARLFGALPQSRRTARRNSELRGQGDVDHVRKVHVGPRTHHVERLTCGYAMGRHSPESGTKTVSAGKDHGSSSRGQVAER